MLAAALDEPVYVTTNGRRRKLTKREAIITQMVDKSASADLRSTKMLIGMMKEVEKKARVAAPPLEPRPLAAADEEVVQLLVARLRRQIPQEIEEGKPIAGPESPLRADAATAHRPSLPPEHRLGATGLPRLALRERGARAAGG